MAPNSGRVWRLMSTGPAREQLHLLEFNYCAKRNLDLPAASRSSAGLRRHHPPQPLPTGHTLRPSAVTSSGKHRTHSRAPVHPPDRPAGLSIHRLTPCGQLGPTLAAIETPLHWTRIRATSSDIGRALLAVVSNHTCCIFREDPLSPPVEVDIGGRASSAVVASSPLAQLAAKADDVGRMVPVCTAYCSANASNPSACKDITPTHPEEGIDVGRDAAEG